MYNLGKMDVEHGHPGEGVTKLREAVKYHAKPGPADFYLGFGLAQLVKNDEAAHWLEQSLASQLQLFIEQSACFQLARVYQHLGRKEDARRLLDRLKQFKTEDSPAAGVAAEQSKANGSDHP